MKTTPQIQNTQIYEKMSVRRGARGLTLFFSRLHRYLIHSFAQIGFLIVCGV